MWKIWLTAGVAGVTALATAAMGFINDIRFAVILHRTIFSLLVFGGATAASSWLGERFLLPYLLKKNDFVAKIFSDQEKPASAVSEAGEGADEQAPAAEFAEREEEEEEAAPAAFSPLNTDQLNRVSPPNG